MNIPQKLAVIQDLSGIGRCSLSVAIPIISACKVQVYPLPTAVFSNHTGFDTSYHVDLANHLEPILNQWNTLPISVDGIYCGYLGNSSFIQSILNYVKTHQNKPKLFIDPVMGDHGKIYRGLPDSYVTDIRKLIYQANVITPNLTEACLLADITYPKPDDISNDFMIDLSEKLRKYKNQALIITGIPQKIKDTSYLVNYIYDYTLNKSANLKVLVESNSRPGTGDLFASILFSYLLRGFSLLDSAYSAQEFISICTKASDEAFVPIQEGAIFENSLGLLNTSYPLKYQNNQM